MTLIVCAFKQEASLIKKRLSLKKIDDNKFEIFSNSKYILIISGIGKIKSSIATTYIFAKFQIDYAVNFGFAGGVSDISELFLINKIFDISTDSYFFPDILLDLDMRESSLSSFDRVVTKSDIDSLKTELVDMEASAFFEASSKFLALNSIAVLKIVSDNFSSDFLSKDFIDSLLEKNIDRVLYFLESFSFQTKSFLSVEVLKKLDTIYSNLHFTTTQKSLILNLSKYHFIRFNNLDILDSFLDIKTESKNEAKKVFKNLENELSK